MRTIIIENENHALELLKSLIEEYCSEIIIVGEAKEINDSIKLINLTKPDLIFMDIELDDGKSFEILKKLSFQEFYLIFTTAYDQYAVKAFEHDAIDYLLKPYSPKSLIRAIEKVNSLKEKNDVFKNLNLLLKASRNNSKIAFSTAKGKRYCDAEEVIRLEASQSYCKVHLINGDHILLSKPLAEIEKLLPQNMFYRVHNGHTVNCNYIKEVSNQDGGFIILKNNETVPLSRRRKQSLIEILGR